ncbi:MAG: hypothetical protein CM1200mP41_00430 [Gammaproteobacteria bacterium]|nr:MAG: hypothetical protein CM1200mP41_00430 [Gammaproteobacteria bacterium]
MTVSRREFLHVLALATATGMGLTSRAANATIEYDLAPIGNLSLLHFTDCHAQLLPVHYREPS